MDAKITKERLGHMLSYDWLKIVAIAVAAIFVWMLIFTTTETRITAAQQFTVFNYTGNVTFSNTKFSDSYDKAFSDGVFSYEVIEITEVDLNTSAEYASTVMETRLSTSEGDVIFVADIDNEDSSYTKDDQTLYDSYLQTLVMNYGYALYNLDPAAEDGYFKQMESYLNGYYVNGDYANGTLDEAAVERDFRARIEKNKDKRYKKEAQIEQGIKDDIARIQKYSAGLTEFYGYLESGLVQMTNTQVLDHSNNDEVIIEGVYSINLCPDKATMGGLSNIAAYVKESVNAETGETQNVFSAENMNVAFFDFAEVEEGFQYESLLYVNYVIRTSKMA